MYHYSSPSILDSVNSIQLDLAGRKEGKKVKGSKLIHSIVHSRKTKNIELYLFCLFVCLFVCLSADINVMQDDSSSLK